jgi:hypothetical protein
MVNLNYTRKYIFIFCFSLFFRKDIERNILKLELQVVEIFQKSYKQMCIK